MLFTKKKKSAVFLDGWVLSCHPRRVVVLALVLLFSFLPGEAVAKKKQVLFQLYDFKQWADLDYEFNTSRYSADGGGGGTSTSHHFNETYHLGFQYTIYNRYLSHGNIGLDLGLQQGSSDAGERSDSISGSALQYQLDGTFFERAAFPVNYSALRSTRRVSTPFSKSYDSTTTVYGAGLSLKNERVPVTLDFRQSMNETSGLTNDQRQESRNLTLEATHAYEEVSESTFGVRTVHSTSEVLGVGAPISTENYSLGASNTLNWKYRNQPNHLDSRYQLEQYRGGVDQRTVDWEESLNLQLGKALSAGFAYGVRKNESTRQDQASQRRRAWASHKLFKSLTTRIGYNASSSEYDTGTQDNWSAKLSVDYSKELPEQSRLNLGYGFSYGVSDTALDDQQLYVIGESLTIDLGSDLFLEKDDILVETIEVYDAYHSPLPSGSYSIERIGLRTLLFINSGVGVVDGDVWYVDYAYRVNNSIELATTTHGVNASISLFDNRYRLYGNYSVSDQNLLSGEENVSPLTQQTFSKVGADASLKKLKLGASYMHSSSTLRTDSTWEAHASYGGTFKRGNFNLSLSERYSSIQQNEGLFSSSSSRYTSNSMGLFGNVQMRLQRNATLSLHGRFLDLRGQRDQNDLAFGSILETRWRKFQLLLMADAIWQFYEQSMSEELLFSFKLRRYF